MQLKRKQRRRLRQTLCLSTCALLGTTLNAHADRGDWTINTSALYYTEAGGVSVFEPVVYAKQDLGNQAYLNLNFTGDILTGATPTGAMPSSQNQVVTGPSGHLQIASAAGDTPKNPNFSDIRGAFSTTWSQPFDENWRMDLGGHVSLETDFDSLGGNFSLSRDLNEKNTTLTGGVSFEYDNVNPIGGIPQPLAQISSGVTSAVSTKRTKTVKDALIGVTQVMNRYWLAQINLSYGDYNGYLNDPYKQVSVIESQTGAAQPQGEPLYQIYENRPSRRMERSIFLRNKIYIAGDVLDLSYNHGWDSWHVLSNMYEVRYRWSLGNGYFVQPHLRYYRQSAAYFYRRGLLNSETVPAYVSADYRLSGLTSRTIGVEFGMPYRGDYSLPPGVLTVRVEHYTQSGGSDPRVNIGIQQNYSLFPGLSANIVQVDYSVTF